MPVQEVGNPTRNLPLRLRNVWLVLVLFLSWGATTQLHSQQSPQVFLEDFQQGLTQHWVERRLGGASTRYEVIQEGGGRNAFLVGRSDRSASILWRDLDLVPAKVPAEAGTISWRWKVENAVSKNRQEREKSGDDYAARLFVVFDPDEFGPSTEAICYVWAANESVGAAYPNPYFGRVGTIVVESGNQRIGEWVAEERDLLADHWRVFGKPLEAVTAVAIMVDTDDTGSKATAWFDDISLVLGESASTLPRPAFESARSPSNSGISKNVGKSPGPPQRSRTPPEIL